MATEISCTEYITGYSPEEIFKAATEPDTLPGDDSLMLEAGRKSLIEGRIGENTSIDVKLHMGFLMVQHEFHIPSVVTEVDFAKRLQIVGSSDIGDLAILLSLTPEKEKHRTRIAYDVVIDHHPLKKFLEKPVARHLSGKGGRLAGYAKKYRENVIAKLEGQDLPHPFSVKSK
jgi:hypothetical protein